MKKIETKSGLLVVHSNGIIEFGIRPDWNQPDTVETATENALAIQKIIGENVCGLLTHAPSLYIKKEIYDVFNTVKMGHAASAILVQSVGSKIFANFLLKFAKGPTPRKIFTKKEAAEIWLLEQIKQTKQLRVNTLL